MGIRWTMELFMDSKNKTRRSLLCAAERDGTGTWLIPSRVLMAASVIHIPMLCSTPGKATERGKYCQEGMWMNSSSRPSRKTSCGELAPWGLKLYHGGRKWAFYTCRNKAFLPHLLEEWSFAQVETYIISPTGPALLGAQEKPNPDYARKARMQ